MMWGRSQCGSRAERVTQGPGEDLTGLVCLRGASARANESQGKEVITSPGARPHWALGSWGEGDVTDQGPHLASHLGVVLGTGDAGAREMK